MKKILQASVTERIQNRDFKKDLPMQDRVLQPSAPEENQGNTSKRTPPPKG